MSRADVKGKLLRDVLPREAAEYASVSELLDVEVASEHDGFARGGAWPGRHQHVAWWWTLTNGKRVGWNENPSKGWSFPVMGKAKE